jgi:hypothetical protein
VLTGCLDQRLGRDRYRALRGDSPPRPAAALQIPTPPLAALAAENEGVRPVSYQVAAADVQPAPSTQTTTTTNPLRQIYEKAAQRWTTIDSYLVRLRRREVVGEQQQPEELMLFKFRKEPFSAYFKCVGGQAKGREVIYVKGRYENKIHTLPADNEVPFFLAGRPLSLTPDNPLVRNKSRYSITDAGFGSTIERFGAIVAKNERGDTSLGTLKYVGPVKRPEYERPVEEVVQTLAPKNDPLVPGGGERFWFFDPVLHLPMLIVAVDHTGREVEYYCHDRFECPVGLDDNDFNPERLGKKRSTKSEERSTKE